MCLWWWTTWTTVEVIEQFNAIHTHTHVLQTLYLCKKFATANTHDCTWRHQRQCRVIVKPMLQMFTIEKKWITESLLGDNEWILKCNGISGSSSSGSSGYHWTGLFGKMSQSDQIMDGSNLCLSSEGPYSYVHLQMQVQRSHHYVSICFYFTTTFVKCTVPQYSTGNRQQCNNVKPYSV